MIRLLSALALTMFAVAPAFADCASDVKDAECMKSAEMAKKNAMMKK